MGMARRSRVRSNSKLIELIQFRQFIFYRSSTLLLYFSLSHSPYTSRSLLTKARFPSIAQAGWLAALFFIFMNLELSIRCSHNAHTFDDVANDRWSR